jgi:opacity protein-like surface antigen
MFFCIMGLHIPDAGLGQYLPFKEVVMKRCLVTVVLLATLAVPAVGSAAPARPGPYFSGFLGVTVPQDSSVTSTFFGTPTRTFNDKLEFDPSIYLGGTGGYDFGWIRAEGEVSYRNGAISTVNSQTVNGLPNNIQYTNISGSLGVVAVMANAFVDLHNNSPVTPYIGGGIGFAALHLDDISGTPTNGGGWVALYPSDNASVFAYQIGGGVEIALNKRYSLDVGYRYFGTSTAKFDSNSFATTQLKFESHNGLVGFRMKF